jgi:hypothetical protein
MEAQLLRDMIADRDKTMERVQQKSQEQMTRAAELTAALQTVRAETAAQSATIRHETAERIKRHQTVVENFHALQSDFARQSNSLHSFCKLPTEAQKKDPNYVMRMQAQLCKAMHSMSIMDHGVELETKHTEEVVKYQKEMVARCIDERTQTELTHMNQLLAIDVKRRAAEAELKKKLNGIMQERKVLEQQIAENEESETSEAVLEEDLDDDERAAKDQMMKLLTERKAEIAALESKLEERDITIAEMEEEMENEDFDMEDLARARARVAAVLTDEDHNPNTDDEEESEDEDEDSGDEEEDGSVAVSNADGVADAEADDRPSTKADTAESVRKVEEPEKVTSPESPVDDSEESSEGTLKMLAQPLTRILNVTPFSTDNEQ